ncbi:MAG: helix-turn-helix transcriptional regulator [Patescibacteria group bacterium]
MALYNNIKDLRLGRNITQEDLAMAVGVSRQTIVAIEKGNYTPSLDLAMKLAAFLCLPIEKIFYIK